LVPAKPQSVTLAGEAQRDFRYDAANKLLRVNFTNTSRPRELSVRF
jgi:hypothetical protein